MAKKLKKILKKNMLPSILAFLGLFIGFGTHIQLAIKGVLESVIPHAMINILGSTLLLISVIMLLWRKK